jgi:hypothetical protein
MDMRETTPPTAKSQRVDSAPSAMANKKSASKKWRLSREATTIACALVGAASMIVCTWMKEKEATPAPVSITVIVVSPPVILKGSR